MPESKNGEKIRKQDNSPVVYHKQKIKTNFEIKPLKWTEKQNKFLNLVFDKNTKIIICKAPPGVGKTILSIYACLELLNQRRISDILFLRLPIESSSKGLGFLPGESFSKIEPYGLPLFTSLEQLVNKQTNDLLLKQKLIKVDSIGFIKGGTFNSMGIVIDESEDLTIKELRLIMSRIGKFSKMFIIGDEKQSNIRDSGFVKVFDAFNNDESKSKGIVTFEFLPEDCMRNDFMKFILEKFDNLN